MNGDTQQTLIICSGIVLLAIVIFTGTYHIRAVGQAAVLHKLSKGYVKCVDVDGVTRLSPPERCKR